MTDRASTIVAGETLVLLSERAAYWPRGRMLLVADPHFGKAAAFRSAAVPVPRGTTHDALGRLDSMIEQLEPARVVFLGDFLHARESRAPATLDAIARWRGQYASIDMILVRGNHDRRAGDPPRELAIECVDAPMHEAPFALTHHPRAIDGAYVLAGHIHPGARLAGSGGDRARLPCFWFGTSLGVLPAFGDFTGLADVDPAPSDQVWVIAGDQVMRVGAGVAGRS